MPWRPLPTPKETAEARNDLKQKVRSSLMSPISPTGEMTIRSRDLSTGAMTSTRYRMTKGEFAEIWVDD